MLSGSRDGVAGKDLRVAEGHSGVEGVGDGGVPQGVRADVPRDPGGLGNANDHAVCVAAVDRLPGDGSQDQGTVDALAAAGFEDT